MKVVEGKKVVNLTPHSVNVILTSGEEIEIPPSGIVARVKQVERPAGLLGKIPLVSVHYNSVEGLPNPKEVDYIVVSTLVAQALSNSPQWWGKVLVPNTGPSAVRDEKGNIKAVRSFILY